MLHSTAPAPAEPAPSQATKGKQHEAGEDEVRHRDDRSETVGFEHPSATAETLPRYGVDEPKESKSAKDASHHEEEDMSDWEKYGSEDEGDYVKINVD